MSGEGKANSGSQTFDRGLQVLAAVAESTAALSIDDAATSVGLHRSIVYRLVRTLEKHRLIERDAAGRLIPGIGLAVLARTVRHSVRAAAGPELAALADELGMTAFLVVRDGEDAVTVESVEPSDTVAHISYRPGHRHPVDRGAPGYALLLAHPPLHGEHHEIAAARERGWAQSVGEVIQGMASIAAPISGDSAIAVIWLAADRIDAGHIGPRVKAAAECVARRLGG